MARVPRRGGLPHDARPTAAAQATARCCPLGQPASNQGISDPRSLEHVALGAQTGCQLLRLLHLSTAVPRRHWQPPGAAAARTRPWAAAGAAVPRLLLLLLLLLEQRCGRLLIPLLLLRS